jgi:hypothetical protein
MTKSEYLTKYDKSFSYPGLHCALIFHYDSVLEVIESRAIYSEARTEVVLWLEDKMKFYRNNKVDFTAYIDGIFEGAYGDVNQYIEGEE